VLLQLARQLAAPILLARLPPRSNTRGTSLQHLQSTAQHSTAQHSAKQLLLAADVVEHTPTMQVSCLTTVHLHC
jgi:hypothetical protein